jgi:hypothetical protein
MIKFFQSTSTLLNRLTVKSRGTLFKKVSDFSVPSRDVTNQTLLAGLGTGKSLTFFNSVD